LRNDVPVTFPQSTDLGHPSLAQRWRVSVVESVLEQGILMATGPLQTVMVVEDDPRASASVLAELSQHGFAAVSVGNGRVALDQLAAGEKPVVILLDLVMPEMDGWQFLDRLRDTPSASIPVIVTTGTGLSPQWVAARGAEGFLHKPYSPEDLLAELRRVLQSTSLADSAELPCPNSVPK
jgi:CheY-like chemotaxis protein